VRLENILDTHVVLDVEAMRYQHFSSLVGDKLMELQRYEVIGRIMNEMTIATIISPVVVQSL